MRIAYIMSRFPKITETFILYEILKIREKGPHVAIYPLLRERSRVVHPEVAKVMPWVRYLPFLSPEILRANGRYFAKNPWKYCRVLFGTLGGCFRSFNFFFGTLGIFPKAVRMAYEMERDGTDHVHAHFANHPAMAAMIIHELTGIPFSFTAHGSDIHVDQTLLPRKMERCAFAIMISEYNRRFINDACGRAYAAKMRLVHCGVDPGVFAGTTRPRREGVLNMVCVAALRRVKGHVHLIEACGLLEEWGVKFRCHLIGDGKLRRRILRQIAECGLAHRFKIHGSLPRPAVLEKLAAADVSVLASVQTARGTREGIPVTLMEAMASGLPVVASRLSGIPELVDSGANGILVDPGDSRGLAHALKLLAEDEVMRLRLGQAARTTVVEKFNLKENAARLAELFAAVDAGKPKMRKGAAIENQPVDQPF
jgi:glycosyltransferase involved in cell wall biosynthesis